MRSRYTVYSDAAKKLNPLKLEERIEQKGSGGGIPLFGIGMQEVQRATQDLKQDGFYGTFPRRLQKDFFKRLRNVWGGIRTNESKWNIVRNKKDLECPATFGDLMLICGWASSFYLTPEEIWDFERFGFKNLADFTGSCGARILNISRENRRLFRDTDYRWESSVKARRFSTEVGGDSYGDLTISRTDITPERTLDPLGFEVSYRPVLDEDTTGVSAGESVEPYILVALLKYAQQIQLNSTLLANRGKGLKEEFEEYGRQGVDFDVLRAFVCFNQPLPVLDESGESVQYSPYGFLRSDSRSVYDIFVTPNHEIIFSLREESDLASMLRRKSLVLQPDEFDNLVRGIFYKCVKRSEGVIIKRMLDVLNHRFSEF